MKNFSTVLLLVLLVNTSCEIMPRNTRKDCRMQCPDRKKSKACYEFCDCIHLQGKSLDSCLAAFEKAPADNDSLVK